MKTRYRLICRGKRGGTFYCVDTQTGKRTSLQTSNADEAGRLVETKNQAAHQPAMNLQLTQVYLMHGDPALTARIWQSVMDQMSELKSGNTLRRWQTAMRDPAFDLIRQRKLIETTAEHFLAVLKAGSVSTNMFLRRIHNYAVNMRWVPLPVLPKPNWPVVRHQERRATTFEEHQKIVERELNPATRAYYELLWHLGGAQTDIASLTAEDIYTRYQTDTPCSLPRSKTTPETPQTSEGREFSRSPSHQRHYPLGHLSQSATQIC
jgi:hypothetical protein